jgi:hypothetical protein
MASFSRHFTSGLHFVPPLYVSFCSLSAINLGYPRQEWSLSSILRFPPEFHFAFPGFPKPAIPKTKPGTSSILSHPIAPFRYRNHTSLLPAHTYRFLEVVICSKSKKQGKFSRSALLKMQDQGKCSAFTLLARICNPCLCNCLIF